MREVQKGDMVIYKELGSKKSYFALVTNVVDEIFLDLVWVNKINGICENTYVPHISENVGGDYWRFPDILFSSDF